MVTPDGARKQESLRTHPASADVRTCHNLLLGIIQKHGVFYSDNGQNKSASTLVNISLQHGWPDIYRVPILSAKINRSNGESIDPEPGDQVVVAFLNGSFSHPVVVGFLPPPGNTLQPQGAAAPLHHTHWQGSDYKLEKDGIRRAYVAKDDIAVVAANKDTTVHGNRSALIDHDDTLEVGEDQTETIHGNRTKTVDLDETLTVTGDQAESVEGSRQITIGVDDTLEVTGNGTLIVHGGLTIHVIGAADITVDGNTTVTTPTATVVASTKVQMTTPLVECSQDMKVSGKLDVVGNIKSTNGEVGDKVRDMSGDRAIYNGHQHLETGAITFGPNDQQ